MSEKSRMGLGSLESVLSCLTHVLPEASVSQESQQHRKYALPVVYMRICCTTD